MTKKGEDKSTRELTQAEHDELLILHKYQSEFSELFDSLYIDGYGEVRTELLKAVAQAGYVTKLDERKLSFFYLSEREKKLYQICVKLGADIFFIDQVLYAFGNSHSWAEESAAQEREANEDVVGRAFQRDREMIMGYAESYSFSKRFMGELRNHFRKRFKAVKEEAKKSLDAAVEREHKRVAEEKNPIQPSLSNLQRLRLSVHELKTKPIYRMPYGALMLHSVDEWSMYRPTIALKRSQYLRNILIMILVEHFKAEAGKPEFLTIYKLLDIHGMATAKRKRTRGKESEKVKGYASHGKIIRDVYETVKFDESSALRSQRIYQLAFQVYQGKLTVDDIFPPAKSRKPLFV